MLNRIVGHGDRVYKRPLGRITRRQLAVVDGREGLTGIEYGVVVELERIEALQRFTVLIDHLQRIDGRRLEVTRNRVHRLVALVFRRYGDGDRVIGAIDIDRCHFARRFNIYDRQVFTHLQLIIGIEISRRIEDTIRVDGDPVQRRVGRFLVLEVEFVRIHGTIYCPYMDENRILVGLDLKRLTIHLQLRTYRRNGVTDHIDVILVHRRIKGLDIRVDTTLHTVGKEVHVIQEDIRQLGIVRAILDIDLYDIIRERTVLCDYMQRVTILVTFLDLADKSLNGLEAVIRSITEYDFVGLKGYGVVVTSRLEMIDCLTVDGDTREVGTMTRFGLDGHIIGILR